LRKKWKKLRPFYARTNSFQTFEINNSWKKKFQLSAKWIEVNLPGILQSTCSNKTLIRMWCFSSWRNEKNLDFMLSWQFKWRNIETEKIGICIITALLKTRWNHQIKKELDGNLVRFLFKAICLDVKILQIWWLSLKNVIRAYWSKHLSLHCKCSSVAPSPHFLWSKVFSAPVICLGFGVWGTLG